MLHLFDVCGCTWLWLWQVALNLIFHSCTAVSVKAY